MTDLVKSLKIGNNRYVIKDSNALPILTSLQRATLLETGNYLDERVLSDTIFETYDGKVEKFIDTITDNSTWNSSTLTATDYWQRIAFGNNTFVATATNRHYAYSTDNGATWSGSTLSGADLLSVAFGNNKFVLVQKNSTTTAYYSSNGSSWSTTTLPTSAKLYNVKFLNGKFIALPSDSITGMISSDGVNWQAFQMPVSADWCDVAYGNGVYLAISYPHSQDNLASAYSYDGINWIETALPYYASWQCVTFGAGKFVATGYNTTGAYSLDGINWIRNSMPSGLGTVKTIYNGDMFVGCDDSGNGKIVYSYDGIKWVVSEMSEKNKWFGIAYGNDTYVMIGFNSNAAVYGTISLSHDYSLDSISYNKEDVQHLQEENQSYLKAGTGITINNDSYIPNAVITGNPTINSDVVCSGFSDSNYLSINNLIKNIQTSFELVTAIKLDETAVSKSALGILDSTQEYISSLGAYTGIGIRLTTYSNGSVRLRISNTGDTEYPVDIKGTTVLDVNTKYWVKVSYNTTDGYVLYTSTDGETWTSEGTSAEIVKPFNDTKKYIIGDNAANASSLPGSIYLKDTYISVDGVVVWKGVKPIGNSVISATSLPSQSGNSGKFLTTNGTDASWDSIDLTKIVNLDGKFDYSNPGKSYSIFGSSVNVSNHIASGFSNGAYIKSIKKVPFTKQFELQIKLNTGWLPNNSNVWFCSSISSTERTITWGIVGSTKKQRLYLTTDGSTWSEQGNGTFVFQNNTNYLVKLVFNGTQFISSISDDNGTTWTDDITISRTDALPYDNYLALGTCESEINSWPGSIDLSGTYMKVNSEFVWQEFGETNPTLNLPENILVNAAKNTKSIVIGGYQTGDYSDSVALGIGSKVTSHQQVAIGCGAQSTGLSAITVGRGSTSAGTQGVAIGMGATADGYNSIAIGFASRVYNEDTVAIGNAARCYANGAVQIGNGDNYTANSIYYKSYKLFANGKINADLVDKTILVEDYTV